MPKSKTSETKPDVELKSIRDGFGEGFLKLGARNKDVVGLSADLAESVRMSTFEEKFPERFFQMGVAEQNMAAVGAGLALMGKIPYIGSFACFQPYRNLDQIRTSICIQNANVKIISSHAGFSYSADGVQVQTLEDIGIMRMLPNMTVLVPADAEQAAWMAEQAADIEGPVYLRLGREKTQILSTRKGDALEKFEQPEIGKAQQLRQGNKLTIIACGYMVIQALEVAKRLAEESDIQAQVLNMHTIKPLDHDAILQAAIRTGKIVTIEEHQKFGGLGAAVAEYLTQTNLPVQLRLIGVNDAFGDSAKTTAELWDKYGLGVDEILSTVKKFLQT